MAVAVSVVAVIRVTDIPPLTAASDPTVGRLAVLVTPLLKPGGGVFVGDDGAGTTNTRLLDTEEFIGLVNLLDQDGYRPTVNHVWRTEFGPGYQTDGRGSPSDQSHHRDPGSPSMIGYVGKAGNMAVDLSGPPFWGGDRPSTVTVTRDPTGRGEGGITLRDLKTFV